MNVYLDNNATTPLSENVVSELAAAADIYANPSSIHTPGAAARLLIENARTKLAGALGCSPDEIIFTSGGTESNNLAILGFLKTTAKRHIVASHIEHHAVLNVFRQLEKEGFSVSWIPVGPEGIVDPEKVRSSLREDTALVSIMYANNETGAVQPIGEIASSVKEFSKEIAFHTDAVQAFGKMGLSLNALDVDSAAFSAHKICGPKGVGALYIRKGFRIKPLFYGGHHERGLRPGTENVPGIAGFGAAAGIAASELKINTEKYLSLKKRLWNGIIERIPRVKLNGSFENSLPNTLNVSFINIEGESIIMMLDMEGISVSSGSACTSGSLESSHVLSAMGVDPAAAQGSIRFSLGKQNTEEEIDYVLEKLPGIVERLRKMSPLEK